MKVDAMIQPTLERSRRPTSLCRSWLFVPGAEREAHKAALETIVTIYYNEQEGATERVVIHDFLPTPHRFSIVPTLDQPFAR